MNLCRTLSLPLIGLVIIVITICLLVGFASIYKSNQYSLLKRAEIAHSNARERLQLSKQEQHNIEQYLPHYQRLLQTGFIGEEQRHAWIARLHQVGMQHQLFNIDYKIGQQTAYDSKLMLGGYKMHRSAMTLRWGLLHEDDFIHLLSGLREGISPFIVRDCEIAQAPEAEINSQRLQENLIASCVIDWLTLRDASVKVDL